MGKGVLGCPEDPRISIEEERGAEKYAEFVIERRKALDSLKSAKEFYAKQTTWSAKDRIASITSVEQEVAASNLTTHSLVTGLF